MKTEIKTALYLAFVAAALPFVFVPAWLWYAARGQDWRAELAKEQGE